MCKHYLHKADHSVLRYYLSLAIVLYRGKVIRGKYNCTSDIYSIYIILDHFFLWLRKAFSFGVGMFLPTI